ncbi:MAG: aldehyde dehydrogenase family protein [Luteibaculaceae bacterium]
MEAVKSTVKIDALFKAQVQAFQQNLAGKPLAERKQDLKKIDSWVRNNTESILTALHKDAGKPRNEALLSEVKTTLTEIADNLKHMEEWNATERVAAPMSLLGTRSKVIRQPKGVALIIAPWNFPFQLTVIPLISAIAAGCRCILKPSEFAPHTAQLLEDMFLELFPAQEYAVVQGDVETAKALLALPFNHIFFTGSPQVGKIVMRAAAEHLTSVTLELGGCNPLIVEPNANLSDAATKIAWGKLINAGQSCVSPNLIFVPQASKEAFVQLVLEKIESIYGLGSKAERNGDMGRIINANHFNRVKRLIDDALEKGAVSETEIYLNAETNFIGPVVLSNVTPDMNLYKEEIFGPVFPIKTYQNKEEIEQHLAQLPTPLAFYVFGDEKEADKWIENSRAGTTAVNDTTLQVSHPNLPFGGCNTSGIGKCHGYYGFREFVNERAVLYQPVNFYSAKIAYPPFNGFKNKLIQLLAKSFR